MTEFLRAEVATIAFCWRIERRDGVAIGLTAHDRDLERDELTYRAAAGAVPSAIVRSDGLEPDTMDLGGVFSHVALSDADLMAGRWDGARVVAFALDWRDPGQRVGLGEGIIGAVETGGGGFVAELRGASAALDRPVVEETSPSCRAELGDARCRVPMAGRRRFVRVLACEDGVVTVDTMVGDGYAGGRLRWFGGANCGLEQAVAASDGATLSFRDVPAFAVAAGTLAEIVEGCDKVFATCAGRFGNAANFRGEPFLPGIDLLTRYSGE